MFAYSMGKLDCGSKFSQNRGEGKKVHHVERN